MLLLTNAGVHICTYDIFVMQFGRPLCLTWTHADHERRRARGNVVGICFQLVTFGTIWAAAGGCCSGWLTAASMLLDLRNIARPILRLTAEDESS